MFNIKFYRKATGYSEIESFLEELENRSNTDKNSRIQYRKITQYIQLLSDYGTMLGENVAKHLEEDIWELRPADNRVLFFYHRENTYVLLHHFRKKTQKTPRREIEKAKAERDDWILRNGE